MTIHATALIAEDEALLAAALKRRLAEQWPELTIVAEAGDGLSATALALQETPDVIFLDIRLPGRDGLQVAQMLLDEWPPQRNAPLLVFVTAYEEYALDAFEREALDYLHKPVTAPRLAKTIQRLQARLAERSQPPRVDELAGLLRQLAALDKPAPAPEPLHTLLVGIGNTIRIVPVGDVLYVEAADKYSNIVTAEGEGLVRLTLRELQARLPEAQFMQVHRSILVNRQHLRAAVRHDDGKVTLQLTGEKVVSVSRAFVHLFRAM